MKFLIHIKYYHPAHSIGLEDIRNAWYLPGNMPPVKLSVVVYHGQLTYRYPVTGKRISYRTLKKGLVKKKMVIRLPLELLPF